MFTFHPMKYLRLLVLPLIVGSLAQAQPRYFAEAGVSLALVSRADRSIGSGYTLLREEHDRTEASPFVAAGIAFSERFRVRASYRFMPNLESSTELMGGGGGVTPFRFSTRSEDDVHVFSIAPEFVWKVRPKLALSLAPVLNAVLSRGDRYTNTDAPHVLVIPRTDHSDEAVTLGGLIGVTWTLGRQTEAVFHYQYVDLKPSFGRTAQLLSAGMRWSF